MTDGKREAGHREAGNREAWITGIGIVSSLGEGGEVHWQALDEGRVGVQAALYAPYMVHPVGPIDFDKQIPKKGDQRQMEPWQRIGTYAAGLALDDAGVKGQADLLGRMDLVVAAGGGERDEAVDGALLTAIQKANDPEAFLNERLMNDLRPTLFLAQLSNLLAGNISIVHGVTGSSRTLMGEEAAGVDAVRISLARILAGQSDIALVGGSRNAERKDSVLAYAFDDFAAKDGQGGIWENPQRGFGLGSMGAFLVIEASDHAAKRGAAPLARLTLVRSEGRRREPGSISAALEDMLGSFAAQLHPGHVGVISGASGAPAATGEEREFLLAHPELPVRTTAAAIGHALEPQFPMNIALAVACLRHGKLFASHDTAGVETPFDGALRQAIVTSVGHWRGEGLALVESVGEDAGP